MVVFIELKGNAYERGIQQGELLKEKIHHGLDHVFHSKMFRNMIPKFVPLKAALFALGQYARSKIRKPIKDNMPQLYEKMKGIVDSSGIPKHMIYVVHFVELINMMPNLIYSEDPNKTFEFACSQLFALNGATNDGNNYFARNYDFPTVLQPFQMVRREYPDEGYANLNVSQFPWAPSHIGVNEKGVAVGYNNGRSWRKDIDDLRIKGIPSTFLIQRVLEQAKTTEEAIEIITTFPARTIGGHFGILDAEGTAKLVETTASRHAIRYPQNGILAHTNHYVELEDANLPENVKFKVEGLEVHPQASPRARIQRIKHLLEKNHGSLNKDAIIKILSDHDNGDPDDFTVCTHGESSTLATTVIIPENKEFWTTDNLPCISTFEHFSL